LQAKEVGGGLGGKLGDKAEGRLPRDKKRRGTTPGTNEKVERAMGIETPKKDGSLKPIKTGVS